jgi:nucleoside-diphosphate-sugar epimerase
MDVNQHKRHLNKILVLGSSGQIGSYLCDHLCLKENKVFEFDIVNSPNQDLRINNNTLLDEYME